MVYVIEAAVVAFICISVIALTAQLHAARREREDLPKSGRVSVLTIIAADGEVPQLQYIVRGQIYNAKGWRRPDAVYIADCGLQQEYRRMAEILAENGDVALVQPEQLSKLLEDGVWRSKSG